MSSSRFKMPWYFPEPLKKRMARYLIQYYLGSFLEQPISLDDLSLCLYKGKVDLTNIHLDVAALNKVLCEYKIPFEIIDGYIELIVLLVPWTALLSENIVIEVHGLELSVQPKKRSDNGGMDLDSMVFNSMTASMQMAEECLKEDVLDGEMSADDKRFIGPFDCAQAIDAVLSRIKVRFINTVVRLEHMPKDMTTGAALEIKIARIEYFDDLAEGESQPQKGTSDERKPVYEMAAFTIKNLQLTGVQVFCDECKADIRTSPRAPAASSTELNTGHRLDSFSESPEFCSMVNNHQPVITDQPTRNGWSPETDESKTSEPVLIMELNGMQGLKLKIKRKDDLPGAKLDLECNLGSVSVHLSPHLLHLLTEVVNGISSPGATDNSRVPRTVNKRMDAEDYRKVEQELRRQLPKQDSGRSIVHVHDTTSSMCDDGLSTQNIDDEEEDENDDIYMSLANNLSGMSSMESSVASSVPSQGSSNNGFVNGCSAARQKISQRKRVSAKSKDALRHSASIDEPSTELNKIKLKISFLSIIILHEDPLSSPADPQSSVMEKICEVAKQYFAKIKSIPLSAISCAKDLAVLRERYSNVCREDHLSILCKPVMVDLSHQSSLFTRCTTAELSISLFEVVDAVFDHRAATASFMGFHLPIENVLPDYCELLTFYDDETQNTTHQNVMFSSMHLNTPCIKVYLKSTEYVTRNSRRGSVTSPKTELRVDMASCKMEVDITIVDRIHAILNPQSSSSSSSSSKNNGYSSNFRSTHMSSIQPDHSMFSQAIDDEDQTSNSRTLEVHVNCISLTLDVRFPKVDLSSHRVEKPWWQRSLHPEHLFLVLETAKFKTNINKLDAVTEFEVTCKSGEGSFRLHDSPPLTFIRFGAEDFSSVEGFDWPRVMIRIFPTKQSVLDSALEEKEPPMEPDSGEYVCICSESSPFSSKKVMYENKELLCPGDRHDMMDFQDKALSNTLLSIELSLPNVNAFLPDKNFFEIVYNRLLNDLVLWEPAVPTPVDIQEPYSLGAGWSPEFVPQLVHQGHINDDLASSMSADGYGSSSDSEESVEFFTMENQKAHQQKRKPINSRIQQPSKMCLTLNIGRGNLTVYAPVRDQDNVVRKDVHGEFVLELEESCLLVVIGHGGDPELQYICSQIHRANLYHNGLVETQLNHPDLDFIMRSSCDHLYRTIYLSEDGIPSRLRGKVGYGTDSHEDMFSLTIKITNENFTSQKNYLVAAGLRGATLRHRTTYSGTSWFDQLTDFFNVADFDIPGYTLPKIVTELHFYLWSCAVDYRPLYIPYKALVMVESFSFTSNIIAESSVSVLRFLLDDAALFLSDKVSVERVDVKNDYVCVADIGVFELCVHMSNGQNLKHPKIELIASNNIFNIRTCSDSFTVLAELINYLASCGDLTEDEMRLSQETDVSRQVSVISSQPTSPQPPGQSCMEEVPDLMADAMKDLQMSSDEEMSDSESYDASDNVQELYFLPTDGQMFSPRPSSAISISSSSSAASLKSRKTTGSRQSVNKYVDMGNDLSDEEFCIIDEPGLGIKPHNGEPVIRIHAQEPIKLIENHFYKPLTKTDLLKAPDHFPPAVYRYTLKEISVVWFMYGGRDFESSIPSKFGTSSPKSIPKSRGNKNTSESLSWQARGGPGRDISTLMELHLNKMRLQHEVFPDGARQVSRQVLLINEIEILDRLVLSDINKFLYLYSSGSMPRQSHANMLVIKALHVRPDLMRPTEQECSLKVTLQPLRLNIDQDALFFFRAFFTEISCGRKVNESDSRPSSAASLGRPRSGDPPSSVSSTPKHVPPSMGVVQVPVSVPPDSPEPLMTFDEFADAVARSKCEKEMKEVLKETGSTIEDKAQPVYFKSFIFTHNVPIRLDYHGKWVDMEQGTLAGLIVGLAQLNCSELKLKRLNHQCGLLGLERLMLYAVNEWLQDIKKNQLPSLLGGVGPMHSLVQLVQGCIDLFWLPVEQYRKDGRIVRGLQRGANSFMTCTAMSILELTNRLVQSVQLAAETAYDMVSPGPSVQKRKKQLKRKKGMTHPADLREGVANAYSIVKEGICETATNIYTVAVEEHEHKGVTGAIGGIIRQFPLTVIKPVIFTSEATSNVLGGMRNQIHPDRRKEDEEKWKALPSQ